jgi:hypothetical protein
LLIPSGPLGLHLFVIMTRICPHGSFLMLSISSIRPLKPHDSTCTFKGGEHPFITGPSFVVYARPEQRFLQGIQKCVAGREFIPKDDLDPHCFSRICAGVPVSPRRQPWAVSHFERYR